jgi:carbon storage regulator CsrA
VKLGFDAPAEVSVHREEVHRRVQLEKQQPCERLQPKQSPYFSECA